MKKITIALLTVALVASFCGCKKGPSPVKGKTEVAFISDGGTINDGAYNENCYNGVKQYCDENGVAYNNYIPDLGSIDSYLAQINKAVSDGAKVIVCPTYMMEEAVYQAAKEHAKVDFILVDGLPHNSDYTDYTIDENVMPITFAEEEAGFLAGYAAVRDGYERLGFLGGMAEDSVIRYGYGFVQGADYAGIELGQKVYIAYTYLGTFSENENVHDMAAIFYDYSVKAICACGGESDNSVLKAAEEKSGAVIGTDVDQSVSSPSVVFSCVKNYDKAVYNALADYYSGNFSGGAERHLTAAEDGISLTMDTAKFNEFSDIEYNAIYEELKTKKIVPYANTDVATTAELNLVNTEIIYQ